MITVFCNAVSALKSMLTGILFLIILHHSVETLKDTRTVWNVHPNRSRIQQFGVDIVNEQFVRPFGETYLSYRFEEIAISYFSRAVKVGLHKDVLDVGTYCMMKESGILMVNLIVLFLTVMKSSIFQVLWIEH